VLPPGPDHKSSVPARLIDETLARVRAPRCVLRRGVP
jgi:hypothetical protein